MEPSPKPTPTSSRHFFIVSLSEHGFWSNKKGWVTTTQQADSFTYDEVRNGFNMPIAKEGDATIFEMTEVLQAGDWLAFDADDEGNEKPMRVYNDRAALQAARDEFQQDGELEIDIPTSDEDCEKAVSRGSVNGAYVMAWCYLYWPEFEIRPVDLNTPEGG